MKHYTITKDGSTQSVNQRNLQWYIDKGWELVKEATPEPIKSDNFKILTKAQLQELCKDKGIEYKPRETKAQLIAKLDEVNKKTLGERKASNKEFNDSLIKNR